MKQAVDKVSTDEQRRAVSLRQLSAACLNK